MVVVVVAVVVVVVVMVVMVVTVVVVVVVVVVGSCSKLAAKEKCISPITAPVGSRLPPQEFSCCKLQISHAKTRLSLQCGDKVLT